MERQDICNWRDASAAPQWSTPWWSWQRWWRWWEVSTGKLNRFHER